MPVIDVHGVRVNYSDAGVGLPIVFVPGLAGSKEWFCYQASGLSDHYRVISYDLRRASRRVDYSLDLLADDLARLFSSLHVHGAVVVGYELGGLAALRFASAYPQMCLALVLCSVPPSFSGLSRDELLGHLLPGDFRPLGLISRLWSRLFGHGTNGCDETDPLAYLIRETAGLDWHTLQARVKLLRESDASLACDRVNVPTLIVAGSEDKPHILAGSQTMDELLPDSTLEIIEGADHFCFYTRHDLFNAVLSDFLSHRIPRL